MDEDDIVLWQDLLDEVAAGRSKGLRCPFCPPTTKGSEVVVTKEGFKTRVECQVCHRYLEGRMGE